MLSLLRGKLSNLFKSLAKFISSEIFFKSTLLICAIQGLWYALSFRPIIFDEFRHLGFITLYSERLSPFISHQTVAMDFLGGVTREPSYLYYYLMSWPLRLLNLFTHNTTAQVIFLRLFSLLFFILALIMYKKLFDLVGLSRAARNLTLLFLVLTPSIAPLPGAINYDSAIFLISGVILLLIAKIIKNKKYSFQILALLLSVGLLGSLIKFEIIAIFVPAILFLAVFIWRNEGKEAFNIMISSFYKTPIPKRLLLVGLLILSLCLFIERPVINVVKYKSVAPSCLEFVSSSRCEANYTERRNIASLKRKNENFRPVNPFNFTLQYWIPGMVVTQTKLIPVSNPLPIMIMAYYSFAMLGVGLILIFLREFFKNNICKLLIITAGSYIFLLAAFNYKTYIHLADPVAITSRYLLPIFPIFMYFTAVAIKKSFVYYPKSLILAILLIVILFTQGGGISTFILEANKSYYFNNPIIKEVNEPLHTTINKIVIF